MVAVFNYFIEYKFDKNVLKKVYTSKVICKVSLSNRLFIVIL